MGLNAVFWGLRCERGWLQYAKRVLISDDKPGHGIVLFASRNDALEYRREQEIGSDYKPKRLRLVDY